MAISDKRLRARANNGLAEANSILRVGQKSAEPRVKTLVPQGNGKFLYPVSDNESIELSDIGIDFGNVVMSQDDFTHLAGMLIAMNERIQLWIGDCLNAFKRQYGVTYDKFAEQYDLAKGTLYDYAYVADRVEISIRSENLTYSHYRLIASQDEDMRDHWVRVASFGELVRGENNEILYEDERKTKEKRRPLTIAELREKINNDNQQDDDDPNAEYYSKEAASKIYKIMALARNGKEIPFEHIQWLEDWYPVFVKVVRKKRSRERVNSAMVGTGQK